MRLLLLALAGTLACQSPTAPAEQPPASEQDADGEQRARAAGAALIGTPGPALTLATLGDPIDLTALYGERPIYLKFWASWCAPCREQMPGFKDIHARLGDRMTVVAVNTGFADHIVAIQEFIRTHDLRMPVAIDDGELAAALHLRVTPQHVVIGRDGRILHVGHQDDRELHGALERALADTGPRAPIAPREPTPPRLAPGDPIPDLTLTTTGGRTVALAGPAPTPRGLLFLAPWCEPYLADTAPETSQACRRAREQIEPLAADPSITWLGVSSNLWTDTKDLRDYAAANPTIPVALDESGAVLRTFGVRTLPAVALIGADGRLVRMLDRGTPDLAAALRGALAGS